MSETPTSTPPSQPTPGAPEESKVAALKAKLGDQLEKLKGTKQQAVEFFKTPFKFLGQVVHAIRSPDRQTRRMAWLYIAAQAGMVVLLLMLTFQFMKGRQKAFQEESQEQSQNIAHLVEKQRQSAEIRHTTTRLGSFGIAMNDVPGSKRLAGVVNMAEIEIFVQCDKKSTCDYLEENLVRAKDVIAQILVPMDREDLLSPDGKERLKQSVMDNLNHWLPDGQQVKKVFFSRVLID